MAASRCRRSACYALALQLQYSIRSEKLLCEQVDYNLLFRWFVA